MDKLFALSKEFRALSAAKAKKDEETRLAFEEETKKRRRDIFANAVDVSSALVQLRALRTTEKPILEPPVDRLVDLKAEIEQLLQKLPQDADWKLRYCMEVDPEDTNAIVTFGGGMITDASGLSLFHDHCAWCQMQVDNGVDRQRCLQTGNVLCMECVDLKARLEGPEDNDKNMVITEMSHPLVLRLSICVKEDLKTCVADCFRVYSARPCMALPPFDHFLTYGQVWSEALELASRLPCPGGRVGIYTTNKLKFYLVDLACIIAGCTSVGISHAHHSLDLLGDCNVIVTDETDLKAPIPLIRPVSASVQTTDIYTVFFSSGSTGRPKGVQISNRAFLRDFIVPSAEALLVQASFLPPAWGADRLSVYQAFFNGGRIGFATMENLTAHLISLAPTIFFGPPACFDALLQVSEDLLRRMFRRVSMLGVGGAAPSKYVMDRISSMVGCKFAIGFGTSEVGAIATDGLIDRDVQVKIENGQIDDEGWSVGSLWAKSKHTMFSGYTDGSPDERDKDGFFKTGDICRVNGNRIEIIGRENLSAVKRANGVWFSSEKLESDICLAFRRQKFEVCALCIAAADEIVCVIFGIPEGERDDFASRLGEHFDDVSRILFVENPLDRTFTTKLNRKEILKVFCANEHLATHAHRRLLPSIDGSTEETPQILAEKLLGRGVDIEKSILENGASSILAARFANRFDDTQLALISPIGDLQFAPLSAKSLSESSQRLMQEDLQQLQVERYPAAVSPSWDVLLTGANGFVGIHLLMKEIECGSNVICLVRSRERLVETMKLHGCEHLLSRIQVVLGDLVDPNLGLSDFEYMTLGAQIGKVIHAAARVDWRLDYARLRAPNVLGTWHVLSFCSRFGCELIHISTQSAMPDSIDGYGQSKFVAEELVRRFSLSRIVRLPFVSFSRKSGISNPKDWVTLIAQSCIQLQRFPLSFRPVEAVECDKINLDPDALYSLWSLDVFLRQVAEVEGFEKHGVSIHDFCLAIQSVDCPATPIARMIANQQRESIFLAGGRYLAYSKAEVEKNVEFIKRSKM